jgi:hypothetical protein
MAPRKIDNTSFTDIGIVSWKEFTGDTYNPGIMAVQPLVEMLGSAPYARVMNNASKETKQTVLYDAEYPFDYFYRKLVLGMGFVNESGELDREKLRLFVDDLYQYACDAQQRQREAEIRKQAEELAVKFPHMNVEQWFQQLKGVESSVEADTKKEGNVTTTPETTKAVKSTKATKPSA